MVSVQISYALSIQFGLFQFSTLVSHTNYAELSEFHMYLPSHRNTLKGKEIKWLLKWLGRFWFLSLRRQTFVVGCFQTRQGLLSEPWQAFFFFLLTFSFAIWLLIVFILYWKGRYIFSEATWYKFWYSQFFLSSTRTGAALSLVPQPTHPAPATEDAACLRHPLFPSCS